MAGFSLRSAGMAALAVVAALGGVGRKDTAASPASAKPAPGQFLRFDVARRSVELTLIAGDGGGNNGFNFDGYGRGELLVTVPQGWQVTVRFKNASVVQNSCAVVAGANATTVAFPGASTPAPVEGLPPGAAATFRFTAARAGSYRFASVVAGHEQARMWDVLEVTRGGKPTISARPGP